jgi:hypothetical protein
MLTPSVSNAVVNLIIVIDPLERLSLLRRLEISESSAISALLAQSFGNSSPCARHGSTPLGSLSVFVTLWLFQSSGSYRDIDEDARWDQASSLCESVCGDRSAFELKADLAQPISSSRTKAWAALRCD